MADYDSIAATRYPDYFSRVRERMALGLQVLLFKKQNRPLDMLTLLAGRDRIIARDFGMDYSVGRDLNLYFLAMLKTIEYAIERGIHTLDLGATTYATKLQFGGRLDRKWMYVRFRIGIVNTVLRQLVSLFGFEHNDPELAHLRQAKTG